ncbi:hypothetical protein [Mesonia aquimarina]|uniref:hypothetical protein n=1 Tax=Mesonia aquimarina TaxID=1504967 RepID=UPI000EF5BA4F|nr:hypothetical protein [Mesonia aquimarina]
MKRLFIFSLIFLSLFSCNKDDDQSSKDPVSQLPAATQTGENTFGCLLDGEVFLPDNHHLSLDCVYQYVNGGYYFALQGNRDNENFDSILIGVSTNDLKIEEEGLYPLRENIPTNAYGTYGYAGIFSQTSQQYTGELIITYLDEEQGIVLGTFWFDIEDHNGVVHRIRKGRFDMQFTN